MSTNTNRARSEWEKVFEWHSRSKNACEACFPCNCLQEREKCNLITNYSCVCYFVNYKLPITFCQNNESRNYQLLITCNSIT